MPKEQARTGSGWPLLAAIGVISTVLLVLFIFIGIRLIPTAMPPSVPATGTLTPTATHAPPAGAESEAKERLDHYVAIGNNVTAFVIAVAGLFAVVGVLLTGWSIFIAVGLQRVKVDAEGELASLQSRVRDTNPEMEGLGRAMERLLSDIDSLLEPGVQWGNAGSEEISIERTQRILLAEFHLAGLEGFDLGRFDKYKEALARANRVLGRFYAAKYFAGVPKDLADWYRSGIYLARAEELKTSAAVLSDVATQMLAVDVNGVGEDPTLFPADFLLKQREKAASKLRRALEFDAEDLSALYALGWIFMIRGDQTGDYSEALACYERITKRPLQEPERRKYLSNALYNCACCVWRDENSQDRKSQTMWYLRLSFKVAAEYGERALWKGYFLDDPDLEGLRTDAANEVQGLLA